MDLATTAEAEQAAWNWMRADLAAPINPVTDPLFAHAVLRLTPDRHLFYFRYHHIALDGFGQALYWQRLAEIYTALSGGALPAPPATASLADLVEEDLAYRNSAQLVEDRNYWLDHVGRAARTGQPARAVTGRPTGRSAGSGEPAFADPVPAVGRTG